MIDAEGVVDVARTDLKGEGTGIRRTVSIRDLNILRYILRYMNYHGFYAFSLMFSLFGFRVVGF